jgi:hypothetical protein
MSMSGKQVTGNQLMFMQHSMLRPGQKDGIEE